jgi:mono/diheme cytochrome c family protein
LPPWPDDRHIRALADDVDPVTGLSSRLAPVLRRVLIALVFVLALAGCSTTTDTTATPDTVIGKVAKPPVVKGDAAAGKEVFETAGCASCHTLKDAGATGTVGPNLDDAKPPTDLVVDRVTNGKGVMPSFSGQLSAKQIADVAAYVSQAAGS